MNSRAKGKRGELEAAAFLTAEGFSARRGQQFQGGPGSPDVVCPCLPALHFEIKRTERLQLYDALEQAKRDAGERLPVVLHRRSRFPWVVILGAEDFLAILRESTYVETEKPEGDNREQ